MVEEFGWDVEEVHSIVVVVVVVVVVVDVVFSHT